MDYAETKHVGSGKKLHASFIKKVLTFGYSSSRHQLCNFFTLAFTSLIPQWRIRSKKKNVSKKIHFHDVTQVHWPEEYRLEMHWLHLQHSLLTYLEVVGLAGVDCNCHSGAAAVADDVPF